MLNYTTAFKNATGKNTNRDIFSNRDPIQKRLPIFFKADISKYGAEKQPVKKIYRTMAQVLKRRSIKVETGNHNSLSLENP